MFVRICGSGVKEKAFNMCYTFIFTSHLININDILNCLSLVTDITARRRILQILENHFSNFYPRKYVEQIIRNNVTTNLEPIFKNNNVIVNELNRMENCKLILDVHSVKILSEFEVKQRMSFQKIVVRLN